MSPDTGEWVKPVPYVDAVSKPFWDATLEGRLTFQQCPVCGHRQFYPRAACTACGATPELVDAAGTGTVHTFTVIRQFGGRIMGIVSDVDPEAVRIGDRVQVWFADAGDRAHIPLWKPAD